MLTMSILSFLTVLTTCDGSPDCFRFALGHNTPFSPNSETDIHRIIFSVETPSDLFLLENGFLRWLWVSRKVPGW